MGTILPLEERPEAQRQVALTEMIGRLFDGVPPGSGRELVESIRQSGVRVSDMDDISHDPASYWLETGWFRSKGVLYLDAQRHPEAGRRAILARDARVIIPAGLWWS